MASHKKLTLAVATLPLVAMATAGCSGEKDQGERGTPIERFADEFCDASLSPDAAKALVQLFDGKRVNESSYNDGLAEVADELKQATGDVNACGGTANDGVKSSWVRIKFGWAYGLMSPSYPSETAFFTAGDQAFSDGRIAYVLVKCSSRIPKLAPDEEHYLLSQLKGPESDLPLAERRKLQVTVLYPVLRKMAGLVGCKNPSDLPASPVLNTTSPPK